MTIYRDKLCWNCMALDWQTHHPFSFIPQVFLPWPPYSITWQDCSLQLSRIWYLLVTLLDDLWPNCPVCEHNNKMAWYLVSISLILSTLPDILCAAYSLCVLHASDLLSLSLIHGVHYILFIPEALQATPITNPMMNCSFMVSVFTKTL